MKKTLLTGIAALFVTSCQVSMRTAHASSIDVKHGRCYTEDKVRVPCSDFYGKDWHRIFKDWIKNNPGTWMKSNPPIPRNGAYERSVPC